MNVLHTFLLSGNLFNSVKLLNARLPELVDGVIHLEYCPGINYGSTVVVVRADVDLIKRLVEEKRL